LALGIQPDQRQREAVHFEREAELAAAVEPHAWMPAVERHEIRIIAAPRTSAGLNGDNGKAGENDRNRRLIKALCEHLISQESEI
ncbi:hypothetical protein ACC734_38665, partial [Rhizobium ruizarguesonis]